MNLRATQNIWPPSGKSKISDTQILTDMVERVAIEVAPPLTSDIVYSAFLEAKKASDAWIKYYLVSVMLMVLAAVDAIKEVSVPMAKLEGVFIGPAALVSFSICGLAYANHELKMRLFRAFFERQLKALNGPDRGAVLLRYPLAFTGASFLPFAARPAGTTLGWRQIIGQIELALALPVAWLLAVPGLVLLVTVAAFGVLTETKLPIWIRIAVLVFTFATTVSVGGCLRRPNKRHSYNGPAASP